MTTFFNQAPIGDPEDPKGQKLLTVRTHPHEKPELGMLQILVEDERKDRTGANISWIDITIPYSGLTLAGMPADFFDPADPGDPEIMLELLDRACAYVDAWRERRACIIPKPKPVVVEPESVPDPVPAKPKARA